MKAHKLILVALIAITALVFVSCSGGTATISVVDLDGNYILENAVVEIGSESTTSISGDVVYAIDGLEAALIANGIDYTIDKITDYQNYAIINIGDVYADEFFGFVYYLNGEDMTKMGAQYDTMQKGEQIEFRFECIDEEGYAEFLEESAE